MLGPDKQDNTCRDRTIGLNVLDQVSAGGFCVGCGACAAVSGSPLSMKVDSIGRYQPCLQEPSRVLEADQNQRLDAVCPFSDTSDSEDQIAERLFGTTATHHEKIGFHVATFAGHAVENEFREMGSSGGLLNWTCAELLTRGLADHVIHVKPKEGRAGREVLFEYCLSSDVATLTKRSKSRYHPIELSDVVELIRGKEGRYVFVGVPCFVKAMRLLCQNDEMLDDRVPYCLALVCGHLKTTRFAQFLAWQSGVRPEQVQDIDFRLKFQDRPATDYGIRVTTKAEDGSLEEVDRRVYGMYGTDWGMGFFKYEACDYCDDVLGETADISFGDAWLPEYYADPRGCNVVVVRNKSILQLFAEAASDGRIHIEPLSASRVAESQAGGLRHRREGLSYRLHLKDRQGQWRPQKRVHPKSFLFRPIFRRTMIMRMALASNSHSAFNKALIEGQLNSFIDEMNPLVLQYKKISRIRGRTIRRVVGKFRKSVRQILARMWREFNR